MNAIRVDIKVHANYVQTCVRRYGATALSYDELSRFGADVPKFVTGSHYTAETFWECLLNWKEETYDVTVPYFEGFEGYFGMRLLYTDATMMTDYAFEEVRFIDAHRGGKDLTETFNNPAFKQVITQNVINAITDKDADKLMKLLNALKK